VEIIHRVVTLYSRSGETIETGNTVQGDGSIQIRDTIQTGDATVGVETLYGQIHTFRVRTIYSPSSYTVQSEWRHYRVRVDTLYSQNAENIQSE
jgi:hypothetical protein